MTNRADNIHALNVPCRYCGAKTGKPCHNTITGEPLRMFTAHQRRITDADHIQLVEDDEVIF